MDWNLLGIAFGIIMIAFALVLLWGVGKAWKTGNKFLAFVLLLGAVAVGIGWYALFSKYFFK